MNKKIIIIVGVVVLLLVVYLLTKGKNTEQTGDETSSTGSTSADGNEKNEKNAKNNSEKGDNNFCFSPSGPMKMTNGKWQIEVTKEQIIKKLQKALEVTKTGAFNSETCSAFNVALEANWSGNMEDSAFQIFDLACNRADKTLKKQVLITKIK